MLERTSWRQEQGIEPKAQQPQFVSLVEIKLFTKRFWKLISSFVLASLLLTGLYVATATPLYTAHTQLLIGSKLPRTFSQQFNESFASLDTPQMQSRIALIRSEKIAEQVVTGHGLIDDPKFWGKPSALRRLKNLILGSPSAESSTTPPPSLEEKIHTANGHLLEGMKVKRVGLSHAIDILYSSQDPELAARLANAIADAYVQDRLMTRVEAARQGSAWFEKRIAEIRRQMNSAALETQQFKARHDYSIGKVSKNLTIRPGSLGVDPVAPNPINEEPYTLEELEARAHTFRKIYESYLQAYATSVQSQSYPVTSDRVITRATPPTTKSWPRPLRTMAIGMTLAGLAGLGLALLLYSFDQTLRTPRQVREELGIECLGQLAKFDVYRSLPLFGRLVRRLRSLLGWSGNATVDIRAREVIDLPFSRFTEDIRSINTAIQLSKSSESLRTLGVASALAAEGKSTFATNLATLNRMNGARVLLVDADAINPSLSRIYAPDNQHGLIDILDGAASIADSIIPGDNQIPDFLPAAPADHIFDSGINLGGNNMRALLAELEEDYDLVVFDVPPLKVGGEALALCPLLDGVALLTQWGSTQLPTVSELVHELRRAQTNLLGIVLTKAEEDTHEVYGPRAGMFARQNSATRRTALHTESQQSNL